MCPRSFNRVRRTLRCNDSTRAISRTVAFVTRLMYAAGIPRMRLRHRAWTYSKNAKSVGRVANRGSPQIFLLTTSESYSSNFVLYGRSDCQTSLNLFIAPSMAPPRLRKVSRSSTRGPMSNPSVHSKVDLGTRDFRILILSRGLQSLGPFRTFPALNQHRSSTIAPSFHIPKAKLACFSEFGIVDNCCFPLRSPLSINLK